MKRKLIATTLFLFFILTANAQGFFLLKNGNKVEYKKYKIKDKYHHVEIKKPKPAIVNINDVELVVSDKGEIRYLRPAVEDFVLFDPDYALMEKIIDGKISIFNYSETYTTGGGQYGGNTHTITYYFMEKDGKFNQIFNSDLLESGKKYNMETFCNYFSDDDEVLKTLTSDSFKAKNKNILDLVRKYNINAFQDAPLGTDFEQCDAILFRGYSNQAKALVAEIQLGDKKITLEDMNYKRIKLPAENLIKICVSNGKTDFCDLISGSKHMVKYFEIQLKVNGEIEIEVKNKKQYQRYINALNDSY